MNSPNQDSPRNQDPTEQVLSEQESNTRQSVGSARDVEQDTVLNDPQDTPTSPDVLSGEEAAEEARENVQRGFNG
ncbi:MAG: hypothetical protein H0T78_12135 [Longispora sp.]|nr:hypothetical protein [Longispora sp. (in: high G+C Gram-positive bacteria)]